MKGRIWVWALAVGIGWTAFSRPASAQLNPFAPPAAMDALNSASPSGGLVAGTYIDRARSAAAASATPAFGAPAPAPGAPPFGAVPAAPGVPTRTPTPAPRRSTGYGGYNYGYGGATTPTGPGGATPTPTPTPIPTKRVKTGERVRDPVIRLLDPNADDLISDYYYEDLPESEIKGKFFDDGTHGDEVAGDGLYTNVQPERFDVISPETHQVLVRLLKALESAEKLNPLEFYRLPILTTETISEIGKWREKEKERDILLRQWAEKFVNDFRATPDDPKAATHELSEFYPLFVPPPPPPPSRNLERPKDANGGMWMPPTLLNLAQKAAATPGGPSQGGAPAGYGYGAGAGGRAGYGGRMGY
ncbi:MAG: hypothetical protein NTW86_13530 [Candidatus Sumerlaeota bacterium]|nr:hypothetical protein [Candidatus Sumerlaeota bacterium]